MLIEADSIGCSVLIGEAATFPLRPLRSIAVEFLGRWEQASLY